MRSIRGSGKGWSNLRSKQKPPRKKMKCYEKRGEKLSDLGYAGYQAYLQSEDWKRIRDRKLQRYPHCVLCGAPSSQVHHLGYDYETLLGMIDHRLVQLCRSCHEKIEFDGERKRDLREANQTLFQLAEKTERGKSWIRWTEDQKLLAKRARRKRNRDQRRKS